MSCNKKKEITSKCSLAEQQCKTFQPFESSASTSFSEDDCRIFLNSLRLPTEIARFILNEFDSLLIIEKMPDCNDELTSLGNRLVQYSNTVRHSFSKRMKFEYANLFPCQWLFSSAILTVLWWKKSLNNLFFQIFPRCMFMVRNMKIIGRNWMKRIQIIPRYWNNVKRLCIGWIDGIFQLDHFEKVREILERIFDISDQVFITDLCFFEVEFFFDFFIRKFSLFFYLINWLKSFLDHWLIWKLWINIIQ